MSKIYINVCGALVEVFALYLVKENEVRAKPGCVYYDATLLCAAARENGLSVPLNSIEGGALVKVLTIPFITCLLWDEEDQKDRRLDIKF